MKTSESKDLKLVCQGKNLKVRRAKTQSASERDVALVKAAKLVSKQPGTTDVSIEWSECNRILFNEYLAYIARMHEKLGKEKRGSKRW